MRRSIVAWLLVWVPRKRGAWSRRRRVFPIALGSIVSGGIYYSATK